MITRHTYVGARTRSHSRRVHGSHSPWSAEAGANLWLKHLEVILSNWSNNQYFALDTCAWLCTNESYHHISSYCQLKEFEEPVSGAFRACESSKTRAGLSHQPVCKVGTWALGRVTHIKIPISNGFLINKIKLLFNACLNYNQQGKWGLRGFSLNSMSQ